uniref:RNA polymerase sigma factor n=1 Tax=Geranium incanum TaxID=1158081 RepID=A0A0G2SUD1_9ROSI|nr:sigma factor [Geranium incanum]
MSCLLPQFKCQPDTLAINFRAPPPTKVRGPIHFQARCVLSTISAPTSTATVLDAEKLKISSIEAHSNSVSAKSPWTHIEAISPPTEANLEATLAREALITSDEAITNAAAAEAIALAKAAVKVAKDAKNLMFDNYQYIDTESIPIIPPEVNSTQSSLGQLIETEEVSGVGVSVGVQTGLMEDCSFQDQTEDFSELEPMDEELKLLEEQFSNSVAVRSTRVTERKTRRAKAATKAASNVVSVQPRAKRKKRGSGAIKHADPLRHIRITTRKSKLLTAAEERQLSIGIQDLLKLEMLHNEIADRCGGEPTFTQWAAAAGIDQRTLRSRLHYGSSCKNRMVKCNIRLVVSIAKNYMGAGVDLQDLIQDGCRGLIKATEKFDASRGFKFSTYAHWWIKQAVQKGMNQKSKFNTAPAHLREASYKLKRAKEQFINDHRREPNNEELALAAGVTMKKLDAVNRIPKIISLDQKTNGFPKPSETIADPNQESQEQMAMREFLKRDIDKILDTLSPREGQVLRWRFGLVDGRNKGLQEIGELMSVSRERIRQIELKAFRKLRGMQEVKDLENYQYQFAECGNNF